MHWHGSTAQRQPECHGGPFHWGAVDFFDSELAASELLAYRPIRANWRAMWSDWGVPQSRFQVGEVPGQSTPGVSHSDASGSAHCAGDMRCVSRGSHGDSCVAAVTVGRPSM
jgi:hypothetical protein